MWSVSTETQGFPDKASGPWPSPVGGQLSHPDSFPLLPLSVYLLALLPGMLGLLPVTVAEVLESPRASLWATGPRGPGEGDPPLGGHPSVSVCVCVSVGAGHRGVGWLSSFQAFRPMAAASLGTPGTDTLCGLCGPGLVTNE